MRADAAIAELGIRERGDKALGRLARTGQVRLGQQDSKLLAAQPGGEIDLAEVLAEDIGDVAEDAIAGRVAEGVVDPLEVVQVDERDRERPTRAAGPNQLGRGCLREGTPIGQVCEVVRARASRVAREPHEREEHGPRQEPREQ